MNCAWPIGNPQPGRPTVLVVESEILLRMAVASELRQEGFNVAEAANADEAFSILHSGIPIDLVLADLGMRGPQEQPSLVGAIRAEYPDVKMVVAAQPNEHGLDDAVDVMLRKPYDVSKAAGLVRTLLDP